MTKKIIFLHKRKQSLCFLLLCMFFAITAPLGAETKDGTVSWNKETERLTVEVKEMTVGEIINHIESNSDYIFVYSEDINDILGSKTSISLQDKDIETVLKELLNQGEISYKISGRQIAIQRAKPASAERTAEEEGFKVTGNVTDINGSPLIGVNIVLKELQTRGTVTDVDGNYTIVVPNKKYSVLRFSYLGFLPQEIELGGRKIVNVIMQEDVGQLDEVVVVAYGSQKKESVVGSITTIQPKKLKVGTTRSLSNNLAGMVSGIIGVQRSGEPGYDNSQFWIRGINSIQTVGQTPLVLIDGIERSLDNIDVEEIESFSVLKDASATAVYGVRGANGVIIVNTKRGTIGKPTVVVKSEFSMTGPVRLPKYLGAADHMEVLDGIRVDKGLAPIYTERIEKTRANYDPDLYPDVDWLDAISKDHASNQRVTLDVSGGSERLRYAFVAAFYNEQGILARDKNQEWNSSIRLQRYNVRSNVDVDLTPTTLMRFNLGGYLQERKAPPQGIDYLFNSAFVAVPFIHPTRYSTGEIPVTEEPNPWALATQTGFTRSSDSRIETLFSLEQDLKFITPGLKAKATFSFDRYSSSYVKRSKEITSYAPATGRTEEGDLILSLKNEGSNFLGHNPGAEFGENSTYLEGSLTYNRTFNDIHSVEGLFLYNQRNRDIGDKLPYRTQGIAGRASYTLMGKYIAEFNFGYNGSENYAKGKRFGFFPSVAAGWIMSEESFMQPFKNYISKLKLRGSYGLVGNDKIAGRRFAYLPTIAEDVSGYTFGQNKEYSLSGKAEGYFADPNLTWETVKKLNLGLDLGLFNNSLDIQLEYFKEKREGIYLERRSVPNIAGFNKNPWSNVGKVSNQGFEVNVNYNKQLYKDFFISLFGTFTYARNKVLDVDEPYALKQTSRSETGQRVNQLFGHIADGLFTEDDFEDVNAGILKEGIPTHTFNTVRPGDIRYLDLNGDGKVDDLDQAPIGGTKDPEIVYGLGVNLQYKSFDFGAFFQGNARTYSILGTDSRLFIPGSGNGAVGNILTNVTDRWTPENPRQDVFYPRLDMGLNSNNSRPSTWWLRNMSLLRLKNLELGYTLPVKLTREIGISNTRFFVRGSNILTFSGFDLWDPESSSSIGASYPIMKSVSFGFNVTI